MAGALAVELMAAVLQHPEGIAAAAPGAPGFSEPSSQPPLGAAPHMIRSLVITRLLFKERISNHYVDSDHFHTQGVGGGLPAVVPGGPGLPAVHRLLRNRRERVPGPWLGLHP